MNIFVRYNQPSMRALQNRNLFYGYLACFLISGISLKVESRQLMYKIYCRIDAAVGGERAIQSDIQYVLTLFRRHSQVLWIKNVTGQSGSISAHYILCSVYCQIIRYFAGILTSVGHCRLIQIVYMIGKEVISDVLMECTVIQLRRQCPILPRVIFVLKIS